MAEPSRGGAEANVAYLAQPKQQTVRTAAGGSDLHRLLDAAGFGFVHQRRPYSLAGKTTPEEAAMNDYAHPFNWAPFVVMGNWL